jgi:hypothetical protein
VSRTFTGKIKKIIIGVDPKNGVIHAVGQQMRLTKDISIEVTDIVLDEDNYERFGNIRYLIWAKKSNEEESRVFKAVENCPVILCSDVE